MKIIDLLNKIANEEEVPHKIKYNGYTYKKCVGNKTYWTGDKPSNTLRIDTYDLNEEVEIIEEDKEIEEIDKKMSKLQSEIDLLSNEIGSYHNKIHSMRDRNNYMKETLKDLRNELKKGK